MRHQFQRLLQGRLERSAAPGGAHQLIDEPGVFGRDALELARKVVQVCGHRKRLAVRAFDPHDFVVRKDLAAGDRAQFSPYLVKGGGRVCTQQPAEAAIKNIRSPVPGGAQAAREQSCFQNLGLETVHLEVAAAGETGDAAADDDDFPGGAGGGFRHGRRGAAVVFHWNQLSIHRLS